MAHGVAWTPSTTYQVTISRAPRWNPGPYNLTTPSGVVTNMNLNLGGTSGSVAAGYSCIQYAVNCPDPWARTMYGTNGVTVTTPTGAGYTSGLITTPAACATDPNYPLVSPYPCKASGGSSNMLISFDLAGGITGGGTGWTIEYQLCQYGVNLLGLQVMPAGSNPAGTQSGPGVTWVCNPPTVTVPYPTEIQSSGVTNPFGGTTIFTEAPPTSSTAAGPLPPGPTGMPAPAGPVPPPAPAAPSPTPLAGDLVAALAHRIGADRASRWLAAQLGVDCGCDGRQQLLNDLDARIRTFLAR
jgi:hypothetical protein